MSDTPAHVARPTARPPARKLPPLMMRHPRTDHCTEVPLGYSLPVALFGPLPLMLRRDWPLAGLTLVVSVLLPVLGQITMGRYTNRMHIRNLLRRGYRAAGRAPGEVSAAEWALGMSLPRYRGARDPERSTFGPAA